MTDTTVKYFDSTMSGAPVLSGTAGALISVLDACLVNGFGSVTLDSLVVADDVATGTISTGHGFAMFGVLTGPVITIEGATPSELNGEWRIASVPSSTTFTFVTEDISDQTATGTITAKRSPAGMTKPFSGTNLAAYRSAAPGTQFYLRINDTTTTYATMRGYEAMSDISTGTNPYPTVAQAANCYFYKASSTSSTRPWCAISDSKMLYVFSDAGLNSNYSGNFSWGDLISYLETDQYHSQILYSTGSSSSSYLGNLANATGAYIARAYTGLDLGPVSSHRYSSGRGTVVGNNTQRFPMPINNKALFWPIEVWENSATAARGLMPGFYNPLHSTASILLQNVVVTDSVHLPGRELMFLAIDSYFGAFDITGPWR
ncbi:MAG: hypothetical protein MUC53_00135 [Candidatus Contendobacter sp.]|jgi:hypothetical protein|nr:hypothetical protein [Candidatus Contendobacter sp.]